MENVSADELNEGLIHITNLNIPFPSNESLRIRVNFEFRKGIWVLYFSIRDEMQCPRQDKLLLILVN